MGLTRAEAKRCGILHLYPAKARRRRAAPPPPAPREWLACGRVEFWVAGRPVGWKQHQGCGRAATRHPAVKAWQDAVHAKALEVMGGRQFWGDVTFTADFYLRPRAGRPPDRTNLGKSTEDACQGAVFPNDTQVVGGDIRRHVLPAWVEGVRIVVETVLD